MLILCPECELQVSDKAILCPHCGYPLDENSLKTRKNTLKVNENDFLTGLEV